MVAYRFEDSSAGGRKRLTPCPAGKSSYRRSGDCSLLVDRSRHDVQNRPSTTCRAGDARRLSGTGASICAGYPCRNAPRGATVAIQRDGSCNRSHFLTTNTFIGASTEIVATGAGFTCQQSSYGCRQDRTEKSTEAGRVQRARAFRTGTVTPSGLICRPAAINDQGGSSHQCGGVRGEKHRRSHQVLRCSQPAELDLRQGLGAKFSVG